MQATEVRAREIMKTEIVRIRVSTPIKDAVRVLEDSRISGAPVVDVAGKVRGVFSMSDLVRHDDARGSTPPGGEYYLADPLDEDLDGEIDEFEGMRGYSPDVLEEDVVDSWMTPEVISVGPDATLRELCGAMANHGVHRLLVLEHEQLVGIVTTLDVVRFLATSR